MEIEQNLAGKIRKGASPSEVIAVLDRFKVDHSDYLKASHRIEAILRHVRKNMPVSESIQVIFIFDEKDAFVKYELTSLFTGP